MKTVINGKRYDTDSAKLLASARYSNPSDFAYWEETLYRKTTGEFFLHGEGGPMSRYAVTSGQNNWGEGEKIMPLSYESAQKWAEKNLGADEYEEIFGEIAEDNKKTISLSLPESVVEKLKKASFESGVSMSEYAAELIKKYAGAKENTIKKYWLDCNSAGNTRFALYEKTNDNETCILRFDFEDIEGLKELEEDGKIGEAYELIDKYIQEKLGFLPEYEVG